MVDSPAPQIPLTEYLEALFHYDDVQALLREQVKLFALLYLAQGTPLDKQRVWNVNNSNLKDFDRLIQKHVRSDIHDNGLTINYGV